MRGNERSASLAIRYPRRNVVAVTLLLFVTALSFIALFNLVSLDQASSQTSSFVTVSGSPVCLPHKDMGDVTTMECAFGLKGDDGRYYGLTGYPAELVQQDFSQRVKVRGILEQPQGNTPYAIAGSISVKTYTKQ